MNFDSMISCGDQRKNKTAHQPTRLWVSLWYIYAGGDRTCKPAVLSFWLTSSPLHLRLSSQTPDPILCFTLAAVETESELFNRKTAHFGLFEGQELDSRLNTPAVFLMQLLFQCTPLVEFMYLVFTCMPGESYCRQLRSLLLYLCYVSISSAS